MLDERLLKGLGNPPELVRNAIDMKFSMAKPEIDRLATKRNYTLVRIGIAEAKSPQDTLELEYFFEGLPRGYTLEEIHNELIACITTRIYTEPSKN